MRYACTSILVGGATPVLEILLISKMAKFPFWTMDYIWVEREIWLFLKGSHISETRETTPTKIGVHAFDINPYLHEFFEPILFFDHMDYSSSFRRET